MEERRSWLPAGLESSSPEPDDRSSQRSDAGGRKQSAESRSDSAPSAAGPWQPYDPDRPESKRTRARPERGRTEATDDGEWTTAEGKEEDRSTAKKSAKPENRDRDRDDSDEQGRSDSDEEGRSDSDEEGRSGVDAMGQDKHRKVIGQRYGASRTKQIAYYGIFIAFVIAAYIGLKTAADHLDKAPAHDPDQAPWSKPNAPDEPLGGFTPREKGQKGPANFQ